MGFPINLFMNVMNDDAVIAQVFEILRPTSGSLNTQVGKRMPLGKLRAFAQKKWCHIGLGGHIRETRIYVSVAS